MKKKLLLGLLVASAPFMLAGCGDKEETKEKEEKKDTNLQTVTCEASEDEMTLKIELEFDKKKEEFTSGSISVVMDLSDYDEDEIEEIKDQADDFCDLLEDSIDFAEGCKSKVTSKEFKADFGVAVDTINEDFADYEDLDEYVEEMEDSMDATCKVK